MTVIILRLWVEEDHRDKAKAKVNLCVAPDAIGH